MLREAMGLTAILAAMGVAAPQTARAAVQPVPAVVSDTPQAFDIPPQALDTALLAFAPAALAECEDIRWEVRWQPDPFGTSGGSLIRVPVCHDGAPATKPKAKRKKVTRARLKALRYRPDAAVSERVRQRMIEQLAYGDNAEAIREKQRQGLPSIVQ